MTGIIKIAKDERGQALVEFAMIFTMLVILLFGIAEFGRGWYYANALSNGARAGARYASMQPKDANFYSRVHDYTLGQMTTATKPASSAFVNFSVFSKNDNSAKTFDNLSTGDSVMVITGYDMTVVTGHIVPTLNDSTKRIVRKATMRYEGN